MYSWHLSDLLRPWAVRCLDLIGLPLGVLGSPLSRILMRTALVQISLSF